MAPSIRDLLFLGKASEKRLQDFGIHTIGELAREKGIRHPISAWEKTGHQLYQYARGIDNSPVLAQAEESKGFSVEKPSMTTLFPWNRCFPFFWSSATLLLPACGGKGKKCSCISVTFRTLDFKNRSHQTSLSSATDVTDEIYENARRLFLEFWKGQPFD